MAKEGTIDCIPLVGRSSRLTSTTALAACFCSGGAPEEKSSELRGGKVAGANEQEGHGQVKENQIVRRRISRSQYTTEALCNEPA